MSAETVEAMAANAAGVMKALAGSSDTMRRVIGKSLDPHDSRLNHWSPLQGIPSRTGGRAGAAMVPVPTLQAAGWRILPCPRYSAILAGRPQLLWSGYRWAVIPPESSGERARIFEGRGRAQAWASECYRAEAGEASTD